MLRALYLRATRHPVLTGAAVLLTALVVKLACLPANQCGDLLYTPTCFNDIRHLYVGRGYAELAWPYGSSGARRVVEYPVLTAYFQFAMAWITHAVAGFPATDGRAAMSTESLSAVPAVRTEIAVYQTVTMMVLVAAGIVAVWAFRRTTDRAAVPVMLAGAPVLLVEALVNWDLLSLLPAVTALASVRHGRLVLAGLCIGLGTATKLYPLFMLGALLVTAVRLHSPRTFVVPTLAAAGAWTVVNAPAFAMNPARWREFWTFNSDRGADLGSVWHALATSGVDVPAATLNVLSLGLFVMACAVVLVAGLRAPATPTVAQLSLLITTAFLMMNKVYSAQYSLWLLPLAVLAVPRWRELLIWQAGEILYFCTVYLFVGGYLPPAVYVGAIAVRILCQAYLAICVLRDMWDTGASLAVPDRLPARQVDSRVANDSVPSRGVKPVASSLSSERVLRAGRGLIAAPSARFPA